MRASPDKPSSVPIRHIRANPCSLPALRGEARLRELYRIIIFKDHINAIVHHIYARGLLLCVRSAFRGEATAGAQRGAARRLRLSAPLHNRSSEYGIVHSFRIHAVISIVGREEPEERGIWLCPPFRGGLS